VRFANTLRGASLASPVGVVPGLAFVLLPWGAELAGVSSDGDAPGRGLAEVLATVGLGGALCGVGVVARGILQERMDVENEQGQVSQRRSLAVSPCCTSRACRPPARRAIPSW
jgi:hypothetical protein